MTEKVWHYLDISSGRYYCLEHGGFCDHSDGHSDHCPLCGKDSGQTYSINRVQRTLRLINGLQERSKRSFTLAVSAFGGLGLLKVLGELDSASGIGFGRIFAGKSQAGSVDHLQLAAFVLLLITIASYSLSMRQVPVAKRKCIPQKTHEKWTSFLEGKLAQMEKFHSFASYVFVLSVSLYASALVYGWYSSGA
ncbi:hypothetical protein [Ruegeria arenilitoris]|uniref:hypothetical protein n=1 Tax=Ruegeria arenilitoris TaxID=1173585 RepID=UPI00147B6D76|nr:hypothetical protein [Ruegeria arenilitoris]